MKKIHWLFGLLLSICYSCSELDDFSVESTSESLSTPTTRYAGDEKYDVLGYGYDVTGEYLHPLSVRNPVLNIAKNKSISIGCNITLLPMALIKCIMDILPLITQKILQKKQKLLLI